MANDLAKVATVTAITPHAPQALGLDMVNTLVDVMQLSETLARAGAGFIPAHLKNAGQVAAVILAGREMGVGPMASLRAFYLINGKLGMDASFVLGRMLASGIRIEWIRSDAKGAVIRVTRAGMPPFECAFTEEDARRAKLLAKDGPWTQYPTAMYRARAATAAARAYAPDVFGGSVYTTEELRGSDEPETLTTASSPARLMDPELKNVADEQARLRNEAADLVPDWIAMLDGYTEARHVEGFLHLNGWTMQHGLPANARGRLWTAIKHACERHKIHLDEAKKLIRESPAPEEGETDSELGEADDGAEPGSDG